MIVPFVKPPAVVIVYLQEPRERFWGLVRHLDSSGIVIQGIDLESFDDWVRHIVDRGEAPHLSTVFFPLPRVEKVLVDATSGPVPSLAEQFERRVGRTLQDFLDSLE